MKRKRLPSLAASVLIVLLAVSAAAGQKSATALPQRYRDWLDKEVAYVITAVERDVFLRLQTDKERDIFVEAFWRQRDRNAGTPPGGARAEHYRRIAYANEFLGRETTRPGWQTDRGRMYIILGPPLDTVSVQGGGTVHPCLIWSYEGLVRYGLPAHFNLLFFKKDGLGEYILYSPVRDGPARLLVDYQADPTNRENAYVRLRNYDSRLAEAALSMLPDDSTFTGQASLASEQLLARIEGLPEKMVNAAYAEALLKYKDVVDVEYSANYVDSEAILKVLQDEAGPFFLHYAVEPKRLSVVAGDAAYSLKLVLDGIVTDTRGRVVFQYEKAIPVDFGKDQVEAIGRSALSVQDMIPLIDGDYRFSLLLKNTASKEFTSFDAKVSIPARANAALRMGPLLLAYQRKSAGADVNKPFKIGREQIACQANRVFLPKETMTVAFQLFGLKPELAASGRIRYTILKEERPVAAKTIEMKDVNPPNIIEDLSLLDLASGNYRLKAAVLDGSERELLFAEEDFGVSPLAALPRPWIVSKVMPASADLEVQYVLGIQYLNISRLEEAERRFDAAASGNPTSLKYAVGRAQALLGMKDYLKARQILKPFLDKGEADDRLDSLMGAACQALGEYEEAIAAYTRYLGRAGTSVPVLNSLGDCYYRQGKPAEALASWEKSLALNPKQDAIRKLVDEIKRKK